MKRAGLILAVLLSCGAPIALAAQPDANNILLASRDRDDGKDVFSDVKLVLTDEKGNTRVRELWYLQKDYEQDEKLLLYFHAPTDVNGVGFQSVTYNESLNKDDGQWIYLPAYRQIRRIASADKRGSFMGSEFAYIDLEKLRVGDYTQKILGEENVLARPCWVIERTPVSEAVSNRTGYYKTVVWVDKDTHVVLKQTYYDIRGVMFKQMNVKKLEKIQGVWTVMQSDMQDLMTKKQSSLQFSNVNYNLGLSDNLFRQSILKTGVSRANLPEAR